MRLRPDQLCGFYAVLDQPSRDLALSLLCVARILQVRVKPASPRERLAVARIAREATAAVNALLVINDDIALAHEVAADGVHLGQTDMSLADARERTDLFLGISTHNAAQLDEAVSGGADYVAYGPVFETKTKENPDPIVGVEALAAAVTRAGSCPVVAIGGITPSNVVAVHRAGASAACVISAVNRCSDVRSVSRSIAAPWNP